MLADVLEEQDAVRDVAAGARVPDEMRDHRQVAAPQRAALRRARRPVERAARPPTLVAEHAEALLERERRRRRPRRSRSVAIGPANVTMPACASAASWNAVKSRVTDPALRATRAIAAKSIRSSNRVNP